LINHWLKNDKKILVKNGPKIGQEFVKKNKNWSKTGKKLAKIGQKLI
jgi:hypothetical protein